MSDAFIFVGSGGGKGGGRKSQILANAPSGSVVTCSNGTVTKTATSNGMVAFKDLDFGTWTLTTTIDGNVVSKSATINRVALYYVELYVVLYDNGDECTAKTGGWSAYTNGGTLTKNATELVLNSNSYGNHLVVGTVNKIDLTDYNEIAFTVDTATFVNSSGYYSIGIGSDKTNNWHVDATTVWYSDSVKTGVISLDVSDYSGEYYVDARVNGSKITTSKVVLK